MGSILRPVIYYFQGIFGKEIGKDNLYYKFLRGFLSRGLGIVNSTLDAWEIRVSIYQPNNIL